MTVDFVIGFESLIAQHQPVRILNAILRKGAIPHALLFSGIEGVGKKAAALAFAMALNCSDMKDPDAGNRAAGDVADTDTPPLSPDPACGICRSCRKIDSGNHPDILTIQPAGPFIRIDRIRELCRVLSMKPYEAAYRVVIISEAHSMNAEAGNALLKILEEPPDRTVLILTATGTADLLPTVVSRCRHIRFLPIPADRLTVELVEKQGMDAQSARALSVLSGGSLSRAEDLSRSNWVNRRKWLLASCEESLLSGRREGGGRRLFAMAATLFPDKDTTLNSLELLKTIYRDALISKYQPGNLLNPDAKGCVAGMANVMDEASIDAAVKAIDTARSRIKANAGVRLTLEALFLTLAKYSEMN